jgi:hypothetical protein
MQRMKFEHVLTLKIPGCMRNEIDNALERLNDPVLNTRSEFLRAAASYALLSLREEYEHAPGERQ